MMKMKTTMIQDPNYRPITGLPIMWKILTAQIAADCFPNRKYVEKKQEQNAYYVEIL